jgi:hypothetical protein
VGSIGTSIKSRRGAIDGKPQSNAQTFRAGSNDQTSGETEQQFLVK